VASAGRRLEGYAAVFASPAKIGGFTESIRAGAFRGSLAAGGDILALLDHNPGALLGRTRSGTLRLSEDTRGLHFDLSLPDTQIGRDVLALAERADLGGMSFGFRCPAGGDAWNAAGDQRELRAVDLHEISVVCAWPAYSQTTVTARSRQIGRAVLDARARARFLESL
jgi:HK97 family phage prohead protease